MDNASIAQSPHRCVVSCRILNDDRVCERRTVRERVENAAQERIAAGIYQTLVFGVVDGDKSEVMAFGKLGDGKAPDGDTLYEIGSVTKTFTATL